MPELAKKITIDRKAATISINGQEFPFAIAEHGPEVENPMATHDLPVVMLPVLARDVEIIPKH